MRRALIGFTLIIANSTSADVIEETFDDDELEPVFARTIDDGWTNHVVDGRLVMAKEKGIPGFSAARLWLCQERLVGDFTADVHVRKDESVGSIGILTIQTEPGWIGFSDIFFTQVGTIAGILDAPDASQASVVSAAPEATFRIERIGETMSLQYDLGDGFVELLARTDPILASPISVAIFHLEQADSVEARVGSFDDFVIEADELANTGADIVYDGVVDTSDLLALLSAWGPCPQQSCCPADIDRDGVVGVSDLLMLLTSWSG